MAHFPVHCYNYKLQGAFIPVDSVWLYMYMYMYMFVCLCVCFVAVNDCLYKHGNLSQTIVDSRGTFSQSAIFCVTELLVMNKLIVHFFSMLYYLYLLSCVL